MRSDGLSAGAGRPPWQIAAVAVGLGLLFLMFGLGPGMAMTGLIVLFPPRSA